MIWIILAAGLGIANFIVLALLFRRLRGDLNRQLCDMRAERNSEWILRALQGVSDEREHLAATAANGGRFEPPPTHPLPARSKKHLGLYIGGGLAEGLAAAYEVVRHAWQTRRGPLIVGVAGATLAAAVTVALVGGLLTCWWSNGLRRGPQSSNPSTAATVTSTPSPAPPPASTLPGSPAASRANGPWPGAPQAPPTRVSPAREASPDIARSSPKASDAGLTEPTRPPSRGGTPPAAPVVPPSPAPSTGTATPVGHAVCAVFAVDPLLGLRLCLAGGG